MDLVKQLEDKKKILIELEKNGMLKQGYACGEDFTYWEFPSENQKTFHYVLKAEIAILEQAIAEMQNKKVYCELCNGEDEASICKWCYHNALEKQIRGKLKGGNLQLQIVKNIQSQQLNVGKHSGEIPAKTLCGNSPVSADISNLLQKQRQEILDKIDNFWMNKSKSIMKEVIENGITHINTIYPIFNQKTLEELKQQLNQPKTEQ